MAVQQDKEETKNRRVPVSGQEWNVEYRDQEWEYEYLDHERQIVRAIVFDEEGFFYFVRVHRNDIFGEATLIQTAGGGVEEGEHPEDALMRELKEELGIGAERIAKIGTVRDAYNLIHRRNITQYYLCRAAVFGEKNLTEAERDFFRLSTLRLRFEEAVEEYKRCASAKLGRLLLQRELPVLYRAKELLGSRE